MRLFRSAFVLALLFLVAAPAAAQQDPLQKTTQVGRYLFAYDQAANRAATMLLSEGVRTDGVEASVVRQHEDGHWSVGFGRLTADGGFRLMHEAVLDDERLVDDVRQNVGETLPASSYYARAARAQRLVRQDVAEAHGPFNFLALPIGGEAGHMTVYAVPAQDKQNVYRLGGDFRYEVDPGDEGSGEIVSQTALHEGYYEVGALRDGMAASAHEAVRPVETDVLFSAIRRPQAPHFVVTQDEVFRVAPDGSIQQITPGIFRQRDDVELLRGE